MWVVQTHAETSTTPRQRHFWWRQVVGLVSTDPGVEEHCCWCELMEVAITSDGLNIAAREAFEIVGASSSGKSSMRRRRGSQRQETTVTISAR
eukprot:5316146-Pyramimonas_sp.AAC.1